MLADSLERFPHAGFHMAIVDHQGSPAAIRNASADLHCLGIATPFEDRAPARRTELCRQEGLEKPKRFRGDRKSKLIGGGDLNPALVPTAVGLDGLVDWQRVKELIGKN